MAKQAKVFSIVILTVAWLFWELWSAFDGDPTTWPLTWVIVKYVPAWITLPAVLVLAVWLPYHFWSNYRHRPVASKEAAMASPLPLPAPTAVDARVRAIRTFFQGLISDAIIAGIGSLVAGVASPGFLLSRDYLIGLGLLVGKSALIAAVSYIARYVKPPAVT
jgi:hypothetical protein